MHPDDEVVPCPTCWLLADLIPAGPHEDFPRSRCARGHENSLVPSVLVYLKDMLGPAFKRTA